MSKTMNLVYSSSLSGIETYNRSFDRGVLRVAYVGRNRNGSYISKETFERCMPSIYNCPIVCNYNRAEDTIGSHDMELVKDEDGNMKIVNLTQPVGVIPESSRYWWEEIEDNSGVHEYLCVDAIIWKRQEAYKKIKEDFVTDESMEIAVKEGGMQDGVYIIRDFEFTAFCLLGTAEPCYESASLELFSCRDFKETFAEMMKDFKESLNQQSPDGVVIDPKNYSMEGGEKVLERKIELLSSYGLSESDIEFDLNSITFEELEAKLKQTAIDDDDDDDKGKGGDGGEGSGEQGSHDGEGDDAGGDPAEHSDGEGDSADTFALMGEQFRDELVSAISEERIETCFGEMAKYMYVDYSTEDSEVYAYDMEDWKLYGFCYSMNGDNVVIDFTCKKRKKFSIVDFDEGEQVAAFSRVFDAAVEKFTKNESEWAEKHQQASEKISSMENELNELREFKHAAEKADMDAKRESVFAQFEDLNGIEAFEDLKNTDAEISIEDLEEKCFAIRGRNAVAKFSLETKQPKLPVIKINRQDEPYNGVFTEFGIN